MPWILGSARKAASLFPPFRPHPLLRNGHAQTIAANYLPGVPRRRAAETLHRVGVSHGDQIALHDDCPASWATGDPAALLLHGLGGCHQSGYLFRAARKLNARGTRAFRMDYRTCGAGRELARRSYHAGQSADVRAALQFIEERCPGSPLSLIGYSMGGNVALKTLGEDPHALPETMAYAAVVNPAIDLAACCDFLTGPIQRRYDRYFAQELARHVTAHAIVGGHRDSLVDDLAKRPPARMRDFDECYTVPHWGFATVEDYYHSASSVADLCQIAVPTLILHSRDDPLVPTDMFNTLDMSDAVTIHLADHGGHLGFIGAHGDDPDRRWMDWRLVDWVTGRISPADVPRFEPRAPKRRLPLRKAEHRPPTIEPATASSAIE